MKNARLVQKGFYSKEALTLENPYKPNDNPYLLSLDQRFMADDDLSRGTNVFHKQNLLYKANEDLLREMEILQKEKEYQRLMRDKQRSI